MEFGVWGLGIRVGGLGFRTSGLGSGDIRACINMCVHTHIYIYIYIYIHAPKYLFLNSSMPALIRCAEKIGFWGLGFRGLRF